MSGLKQLYGDNVVIELVTMSAGTQRPLSRQSRSLLASESHPVSVTISIFYHLDVVILLAPNHCWLLLLLLS